MVANLIAFCAGVVALGLNMLFAPGPIMLCTAMKYTLSLAQSEARPLNYWIKCKRMHQLQVYNNICCAEFEQSENYKNLVAKNEDVTYTRMYQETQKENTNRHNNCKDVAVINSPIEAHPVDIASAFSQKGLSTKQKNVLDKLPKYGSSAMFKKHEVSMIDLSALTTVTGDEFAMFTRKGERLIIRGDAEQIPLSFEQLSNLSEDGFRWSGHTHPGDKLVHLNVSDGDIASLEYFKQRHSAIYNQAGRCAVYDVNGEHNIIRRSWEDDTD